MNADDDTRNADKLNWKRASVFMRTDEQARPSQPMNNNKYVWSNIHTCMLNYFSNGTKPRLAYRLFEFVSPISSIIGFKLAK